MKPIQINIVEIIPGRYKNNPIIIFSINSIYYADTLESFNDYKDKIVIQRVRINNNVYFTLTDKEVKTNMQFRWIDKFKRYTEVYRIGNKTDYFNFLVSC